MCTFYLRFWKSGAGVVITQEDPWNLFLPLSAYAALNKRPNVSRPKFYYMPNENSFSDFMVLRLKLKGKVHSA